MYGTWNYSVGGGKVPDLSKYSYIRGSFLTFRWSQLEPQDGKFNWTLFDSAVAKYADAGLYLQLMVWVGPDTPDWVYAKGVPKVTTNNEKNEALGRHLGWVYPYYLDEKYEVYFHRLIQEVAAHIDTLPPRSRKAIVSMQTAEGTTGDEGPYKGIVKDNKYSISDSDWLAFKQRAWELWYSQYKGKSPPIKLLINQGNDGQYEEWLNEHMPDIWRKVGHVGHGYQLNSEQEQLALFGDKLNNPLPNGEYVRFRSEVADLDLAKWFTEAPIWNSYWLNLFNLHFGTDILQWNLISDKYEFSEAGFEFYNKYAGFKDPSKAPGAFIALRDGLDAADTWRFPEDKYGQAEQRNQERFVNIAKDFAEFGAKQEDPKGGVGGTMAQRRTEGMNDVGWTMVDGNYERYLTQIDPLGTSQGYWRVGPLDQPYGRFARGFDKDGGKTAMYFDLNDRFYNDATPKEGRQATLRVVYYDKGNGKWALKFDAAGDPGKVAMTVRNTDSGRWKEQTVVVKDAKLSNGGQRGADLTLEYISGDNTLFHMVELTR
jgi:hypothetical protein